MKPEEIAFIEPTKNADIKPIRVMCRIRPMNDAEKSEPDHKERSYTQLSEEILAMGNDEVLTENFKFRRVYGEDSTQAEVFEPVRELADKLLEGVNCSVFAYGATGSGKTYTISGGAAKKNGVVQQTIRYLRQRLLADRPKRYSLKCTMC